MRKLTAIILSSRDIGEFDRIYTLYTRELGLVRAVGRGVRKVSARLAGHLEPGTLSEVYIARSRGMGQITSAITLDEFEAIKNEFELLSNILEIFRFFGKNFSEDEKDERIFDLLAEFLGQWGNKEIQDSKKKISLEAFWWKLFDLMGNRPETMKCAECNRSLVRGKDIFFSASKGGAICQSCKFVSQGLLPMSENQVKLLRIFLTNPLGKILKIKIDGRELAGLARIRGEFRKYNF
jgi:DNA repair protein RecO (recombination protein O)